MNNQSSKVYEFGPFRFYPDDLILQCNDQSPQSPMRTVKLRGRAMDVFVVLFERRDGPGVENKELLSKVWGAKGGDPSNLTHAIKNIKDLLRECDKDNEEYIETIPGGYRFKAIVREIEPDISPQPNNKSTGQGSAAFEASIRDPGINKETQTNPKTEPDAPSGTDEIRSGDDNTVKKKWWKDRTAKVVAGLIVVVFIIGLLIASRIGQNQKQDNNFVDQQQALYFYQQGWRLYEEADELKAQKQGERAQAKYNQAEAFLWQAIRLYPSRALYHSALGWALYDQNKIDDARQAFMDVLVLKPTPGEESSAHHGLGLIYEDIDLEKAEEHLKESVRLAPQDELEACTEDLERVQKKKRR